MNGFNHQISNILYLKELQFFDFMNLLFQIISSLQNDAEINFYCFVIIIIIVDLDRTQYTTFYNQWPWFDFLMCEEDSLHCVDLHMDCVILNHLLLNRSKL